MELGHYVNADALCEYVHHRLSFTWIHVGLFEWISEKNGLIFGEKNVSP